MKHKSSGKHARHRKRPAKRSSLNFLYIGVFSVVLLLVLVKSNIISLQNGSVLGIKFLAQDMTPEQQAPQQQPQEQQPQQQSQPQSQPQQNEQPQQQQQQQAPQQQQQPQQQAQQQPQQQNQYQQPNQQQMQQMQQQYQPRNAEEQRQMQQYQGNQSSNQQQGSQQTNYQGGQNTNSQPGQSGQGWQSGPNQQSMTKEQQQMQQQFQQQNPQQYQQLQQQFKQEAAKNGFQFSGSVPVQFQQLQLQGSNNTQNPSGNPSGGTSTTNQGTNQTTPLNSAFQSLPSIKDFPTITGRFEVQSANRGQNVNVNDKNTRIMLGSTLIAKKDDGTQVELHNDALEKINKAIEVETGSKIEQAGNDFVMKRGGIEAQTKFPISFNVATKAFTVQTSAGEKEIAVLPDQAVQKLIDNKIISRLDQTKNAQTGTNVSAGSAVSLTEFNNEPVFEVKGSAQKKFLGFFSVSIPKTSIVSAQTGNVVQTNESLFNRFLDTISK